MIETRDLKIGHVVTLPFWHGKARIINLKDKVANVLDSKSTIQQYDISALCHIKASRSLKKSATNMAISHRIYKTMDEFFKNWTPPELDGINHQIAIQLLIGGTYLMKLNQESQEVLERLLNWDKFQGLLRKEYAPEEIHKMMEYVNGLIKRTELNRKQVIEGLLTSLIADPVEEPELIRNASMFKDPEKAMDIMRRARTGIFNVFLGALGEESKS